MNEETILHKEGVVEQGQMDNQSQPDLHRKSLTGTLVERVAPYARLICFKRSSMKLVVTLL
jgi:hypothetical protein